MLWNFWWEFIICSLVYEIHLLIEPSCASQQEPEVIDLAWFLTKCGAYVKGAGSDKLFIKGRSHLHGSEYAIISDRIEAGTFMLAAAITRSCISISPVVPSHLSSLIDKLLLGGCKISQRARDTLVV